MSNCTSFWAILLTFKIKNDVFDTNQTNQTNHYCPVLIVRRCSIAIARAHAFHLCCRSIRANPQILTSIHRIIGNTECFSVRFWFNKWSHSISLHARVRACVLARVCAPNSHLRTPVFVPNILGTISRGALRTPYIPFSAIRRSRRAFAIYSTTIYNICMYSMSLCLGTCICTWYGPVPNANEMKKQQKTHTLTRTQQRSCSTRSQFG